ncbi:MAG: two-component system response regulator, partial [Chloroflexi bacterium HGW-Chloroflexi-7]
MSDLPFSILLIDDSPSDLMLIQRAFKNCGIVEGIYTLSNGFEAIRYLMGEGVYSDRIKYPY